MVWIYCAAVVVVILGMLGGYFLGSQHTEKATRVPYESGIVSTGSARVRFPVHFYLIGLFFVVFDLESIFIYAWSVSMRTLGWNGFVRISVFISVLLVGLVYFLKTGALDIGPKLRKPGETL
ncbi:MAG: NADH-quinone oxidoreductase subunit A [Myxococcaceae bacterium]